MPPTVSWAAHPPRACARRALLQHARLLDVARHSTNALLNTLFSNGVKAIFFVNVNNIAGAAVSVFSRIAGEGHMMGMLISPSDYDGLPVALIQSTMSAALVAFNSKTCYEAVFVRSDIQREVLPATRAVFEKMGLRVVGHTIDSQDWKYALTSPASIGATVASGITAAASAGALILQHDLLIESVNTVPAIITATKNAGYTFVDFGTCLFGGMARPLPCVPYYYWVITASARRSYKR